MGKQQQQLALNNKAMSFESLFNEKKEDVDQKIKFERNRKGKQVQILAKISNIQMERTTAEIDYRKSLVEPTMDSVALAIEIRSLIEEEKIATAIYKQLFPKNPLPVL